MINTKLQWPYNFQINLISIFLKKIVFWKFYCLKSSSLSLWPEIHLSGTNWHSTNLHLKVQSTKTKQNKTCRLLLYCNTLFSVSSSFYFFCLFFVFVFGWLVIGLLLLVPVDQWCLASLYFSRHHSTMLLRCLMGQLSSLLCYLPSRDPIQVSFTRTVSCCLKTDFD